MDIIEFAEKLIDGKLMPHQKLLLRCIDNKVIVKKGRRTGITICIAIKAIHNALYLNVRDQLIVCEYKSQVSLIMNVIKEYLRDGFFTFKSTDNSIILPNGTRIFGVSAGTFNTSFIGLSPDAIFIDEAAYVNDKAMECVFSLTFQKRDCSVWVVSTPMSREGIFYKLYMNADDTWKRYEFPTDMLKWWNQDMEEQMKNTMTAQCYQREILAEFTD